MQNVLTVANIVILCGLTVLLVGEELRFRQFKRRIEETRSALSALAHQLLTPLSAMRKYTRFLQKQDFGSLSLSQHEAVNKMDVALADTVLLLDRLLARSRIEEGGIAATPIKVDVVQNVIGAMNAMRPLSEEKKHRIVFDGGGRPITVHADPLLLHGIFDEIILNAIAYTPSRGTITVQVRGEAGVVRVTVKDTGIGIAANEKAHIFEKFYRGERARKMFAGSGLGLSFAKAFASECRGAIRFRSAGKRGSIFTITLPKSKAKQVSLAKG